MPTRVTRLKSSFQLHVCSILVMATDLFAACDTQKSIVWCNTQCQVVSLCLDTARSDPKHLCAGYSRKRWRCRLARQLRRGFHAQGVRTLGTQPLQKSMVRVTPFYAMFSWSRVSPWNRKPYATWSPSRPCPDVVATSWCSRET